MVWCTRRLLAICSIYTQFERRHPCQHKWQISKLDKATSACEKQHHDGVLFTRPWTALFLRLLLVGVLLFDSHLHRHNRSIVVPFWLRLCFRHWLPAQVHAWVAAGANPKDERVWVFPRLGAL